MAKVVASLERWQRLFENAFTSIPCDQPRSNYSVRQGDTAVYKQRKALLEELPVGMRSQLKKVVEQKKLNAMTKEYCFIESYLIDKHDIVKHVLEHAEIIKADKVVAMPFLPSALAGHRDSSLLTIRASMQLEMRNVELAVCEEPAVLFVNYNAIRSLLVESQSREQLKSLTYWHTLLFLLFNAGFRLAKVYPDREMGFIRIS